MMYGRRQIFFSICRPYNGTGNTVPFPFHSRLISVRLVFLSVLKPFPFCPKGSSSVLVNGSDGKIKRAWSLIAQEFSVLTSLPFVRIVKNLIWSLVLVI